MPWKEITPMSQRLEFILLASAPEVNISQLCARFSISRKTAYKWLARYKVGGLPALADLSRRPLNSPRRTAEATEQMILKLRDRHPAWGGRKLKARLTAQGHHHLPSASTFTAILHRHDKISPEDSQKRGPYRRFQHPHPNDLWQIDFKGDFLTGAGRCYPLTVLDDHSRFSLGLRACADEKRETVQQALTEIFRRYGLPWRMTMDNGLPWGVYVGGRCRWTRLTVWLLRLGVRVSHSRPFHPQTQGKDERFHRTLKAELLRDYQWRDLQECQTRFDSWRDIYNCERPHEALEMAVPASRYQASERQFPERLPPLEYPDAKLVRRVQGNGTIYFKQRCYFIGEAFRGLDVALRPTTSEGIYEVWFSHQQIEKLDLRASADES